MKEGWCKDIEIYEKIYSPSECLQRRSMFLNCLCARKRYEVYFSLSKLVDIHD